MLCFVDNCFWVCGVCSFDRSADPFKLVKLFNVYPEDLAESIPMVIRLLS